MQPRTLAAAFTKAVRDDDPVHASVDRLRGWRDDMDRAYGPCADSRAEMTVGGEGRLADVLAFCRA